MKKRLRCPHCGEPGISAFYKNTQAKMYFGSFEDILKNDKGEKCIHCNKPYVVRPRYSMARVILVGVLSILLVFAELPLLMLLLGLSGILLWIPLSIATALAGSVISHKMCGAVAADNYTFKKVDRMSNVQLAITEMTGPIHNYDVFGIKFDKNIYNVRFEEAFRKGVVPVMFFRKTPKQTRLVEAYIIKMEFVPEDLLFVGSSFAVVDEQNKPIGKGQIYKIYQ